MHTSNRNAFRAAIPLAIIFTIIPQYNSVLAQDSTNYPTIGEIIRYDKSFDELVAPDAKIEVLSSGFIWSEGPVWVPVADHPYGGYLLFSDIPNNRIVKWEEAKGAETWLQPSGYTGKVDYGAEPGSNGLVLDREGQLISCEHGDRRVSLLTKDGGKITLADRYDGKRLNSPNDACLGPDQGSIYFTDPPYGLPNRFEDPRREQAFCGVYRIGADRQVTLLTTAVTRPNGIAFSPDFKTLYVAQSDPEAAIWRSFPVSEDGTIGQGKLFFDATAQVKEGLPGLPDGLKVDSKGNLWATGPGGVHVFTPGGQLLGRISTGEKTANCGWGNDGSTLYLTSDTYLCRIKTKAKGAGW